MGEAAQFRLHSRVLRARCLRIFSKTSSGDPGLLLATSMVAGCGKAQHGVYAWLIVGFISRILPTPPRRLPFPPGWPGFYPSRLVVTLFHFGVYHRGRAGAASLPLPIRCDRRHGLGHSLYPLGAPDAANWTKNRFHLRVVSALSANPVNALIAEYHVQPHDLWSDAVFPRRQWAAGTTRQPNDV